MLAIMNSGARRCGYSRLLFFITLLAVVESFISFNGVIAGLPEGEAFPPLPSLISPTFFVDRSMASRSSIQAGELAAAELSETELVQRIADVVSGIGGVSRAAGQPGNSIAHSVVIAYDGSATTDDFKPEDATRQASQVNETDQSSGQALRITFAREQPARSPLETTEEVDMFTVELSDLTDVISNVSLQPEVRTMVVNFKPESDRKTIASALARILEAPHITVMQYDIMGEPRGVQTKTDDTAKPDATSQGASLLRGVQSGTAQIAALRQVIEAFESVIPLGLRQVLGSFLPSNSSSSAEEELKDAAAATAKAPDSEALRQRINEILTAVDVPLPESDSLSGNTGTADLSKPKRQTGTPHQETDQGERGASNINVGDLLQAIGFPSPPDDKLFNQMWGMHNEEFPHASIQALGAWKLHTGREVSDDQRIKICVIDSGVDGMHEDLERNMWTNPNETINGKDDDGNGCIDDIHGCRFSGTSAKGTNVDKHGHGTHCAGTVAAVGNNQQGVTGVLWNANIVGISFDWSLANSVRALNYATRIGCKIVSASWGFIRPTPALREGIAQARKHGVLFVSAVDNRGINMCKTPSGYGDYPPMYATELDNIVTVANIQNDGNLAGSSNYCAKYTRIAAPGSGIISTVPGGYAKFTGTSMATPHVAGTLGLIASAYPDEAWDYKVWKDIVLDSVTSHNTLKGKVSSGGILNAEAALNLAEKVFGRPAVARNE
eukprot:GHVT01098002.1.p1 GENE.GHVT01098002.1~~GHVT01098002.1.p1  ORF type:complete len:725 (-),score=61.34 GHVT01098002.1:956-3130(-)